VNVTEQQALDDALAAEHAAVYAYGVVAAFAPAQRGEAVAAATAAHAARRDAATDALTTDGATAVPSATGYALPVTVTDGVTALQLAATVEDATAQAWRAVLERSDPAAERSGPTVPVPAEVPLDLRTTAVAALTDCAVRAAGWRVALGSVPATRAFPGQPVTTGG
jgi:hypothetical protein